MLSTSVNFFDFGVGEKDRLVGLVVVAEHLSQGSDDSGARPALEPLRLSRVLSACAGQHVRLAVERPAAGQMVPVQAAELLREVAGEAQHLAVEISRQYQRVLREPNVPANADSDLAVLRFEHSELGLARNREVALLEDNTAGYVDVHQVLLSMFGAEHA